ncbi:MAG: hypothetical protein ACOY93_11700 [Bacillota bacterium]
MRRWFVIGLIMVLTGCAAGPETPVAPGADGSAKPPVPAPVEPQEPEKGEVLLASLEMIDEESGWGLLRGHFGLVRTADGGQTWALVSPPGVDAPARAQLVALTPLRAWLVEVREGPSGQRLLLHLTEDGGQGWERVELTTPFQSLYGASVSMVDERVGFLLAEGEHGSHSRPGALLRTDDGGRSWRLVAGPAEMPNAGKIRFESPQSGWVVGHQISTTPERLAATQDGGRTWTEAQEWPLPEGFPPGQVSMESPPVQVGDRQLLIASFWPESHRATEFRSLLYARKPSDDAWRLTAHLPHGPSSFLPDGHGWLWAGAPRDPGTKAPIAGQLHLTADGGESWAIAEPDPTLQGLLDKGYNIGRLDFVTPETGWALLTAPGPYPPRLLRTTDGGRTWTILQPTS